MVVLQSQNGPLLVTPLPAQARGGTAPETATPTSISPGQRFVFLSSEKMENVKKCERFLSTLIKFASSGNQSTAAANVSELVKDLLEDKLECEEFTSKLCKALNSSPQPYLVPFLKRSLPALRQLMPDSAAFILQSQPPQLASTIPSMVVLGNLAPPPTAPGSRSQLQPAVTRPTQASSLVIPAQQQGALLSPQVTSPLTPAATLGNQTPGHASTWSPKNKLSTFDDNEDLNDVASMAGVKLTEESDKLATSSGIVGFVTHSCKEEAFLSCPILEKRMLEIGRRYGVTELSAEAVNCVSHATQQRLQNLLEKVSQVAQQRNTNFKEEGNYQQSSDARTQLKFFEQLDQLEKQRKEEQERELLLKAAKSPTRQGDPEQLRLKQKAKEMWQQELEQMRQRETNQAALAAISPRKKRTLLDSSSAAAEGSGSGPSPLDGAAPLGPRPTQQRVTRANLRDLLFCMENERFTKHSLLLYKGFLK
ncbi:transcription initiation factor TFIID subunit 4-like [Brachionichthys hirsutus]|uniref:transcription initiation factor TFIID subunit 4-like n=1 Tax=Brachionichthys hirsutus TaxID=412623 RepID=UPI0036045909